MAHVLIVEDDPAIRGLVRDLLTPAGYEVTVASDGVEALDRVEERVPDLVLLDLAMPQMNGWRFLEALHARGLRDRVRVVIVSADADEETRGRGRREGAVRHLAKPFDASDLLAAVRDALSSEPVDVARRRERVGNLIRLVRGLEAVAP